MSKKAKKQLESHYNIKKRLMFNASRALNNQLNTEDIKTIIWFNLNRKHNIGKIEQLLNLIKEKRNELKPTITRSEIYDKIYKNL